MTSKGSTAQKERRASGGRRDGNRSNGNRSNGNDGAGITDGIRRLAESNPAAQRLFDEASTFAQAKGRDLVSGLTDKVGDVAKHLDDFAESGGSSPLLKGASKMAEGRSPVTAALSAGASGLKDKVKDVFGKGSGEGNNHKVVSIVESIEVGAPRTTVYNQWTQFTEFQKFTKGVKSAQQEDPAHVKWRAKIFWSTRTWDAEITEQVPDQRIAWKSSGDKGTVDGAVTFHELTPDLTKVILQLEYHPHGLFERTGNLWRAQGRRARLDLKHFRRYVMMRGEETGAWRGEIRDGDVVSEGEDQQHDEGRRDEGRRDGRRGRSEDRGRDPKSDRREPRKSSRESKAANPRSERGKDGERREGTRGNRQRDREPARR